MRQAHVATEIRVCKVARQGGNAPLSPRRESLRDRREPALHHTHPTSRPGKPCVVDCQPVRAALSTMQDSDHPLLNLGEDSPAETAANVANRPASAPRRDPSPAPQQPATSPTGGPAANPHLVLPRAVDRHQEQMQQQHSGIVAAGPDHVPEDDEFDLTDGYDTASTGSTSATSSIYAHTIENGRRYQHFKNGRYPIPNDDEELNREDMKHAMLMELCDGELFYAPIGENPQKILDIGTGTGEWHAHPRPALADT